MKAGAAADLIETVYGLGYRLKSTESGVRNQEAETTLAPRGVDSATATDQTEQQGAPELTAIWERFKEKYSDRITLLEQAVTALLEGTITEALRQQAIGEGHTLVGSLGSFGLIEASRLCREIEQTFQAGITLSQARVKHLSGLVAQLRQELGVLTLLDH